MRLTFNWVLTKLNADSEKPWGLLRKRLVLTFLNFPNLAIKRAYACGKLRVQPGFLHIHGLVMILGVEKEAQ